MRIELREFELKKILDAHFKEEGVYKIRYCEPRHIYMNRHGITETDLHQLRSQEEMEKKYPGKYLEIDL